METTGVLYRSTEVALDHRVLCHIVVEESLYCSRLIEGKGKGRLREFSIHGKLYSLFTKLSNESS